MEFTGPLPPISRLSSSVVSFLNRNLCTDEQLVQATDLASQLQAQCLRSDEYLVDLNAKLQSGLVAYASFSDNAAGLFENLHDKLTDLLSSTRDSDLVSDGGGSEGENLGRTEQIFGEELPALAKEVARVEAVRTYAETALKLDTLVGEIEDAVSSAMRRKHSSSENSEELHLAIRSLKLTEDVLTSVVKTRPNWGQLVSAVDHRVDRALAILRPQAIAGHRALLSSLGWPPPLCTLNSSDMDARKSFEVSNPLFTMQGNLKHQYCKSFLALCGLQELQRQRKSRQLEGYNREVAMHQALWVIEELVDPLSIACQSHFSKWTSKPEFIFALVYKITRDYVDPMDALLQPLVDEAMLVGYSCREEWIAGMVTSLSTYLAKEIFPVYVGQLDEESVTGIHLEARISWLHLIDLMASFDKRIQTLVAHGGIFVSLQEVGNLQKISSLSVFCDRPDWLDLWAEMELSDALDKLKPELDDESKWIMKVRRGTLLSGLEDYKSPAISNILLKMLSSVVDHCRSLPTISLRSRFVKLTGTPIVQQFFDLLLLRCQETEALTALASDDALITVTNSINAARYIELVLKEWCDDIFFIEMGFNDSDRSDTSLTESSSIKETLENPGGGIFDEEIGKLEKFRKKWVETLSVAVLRGFEAQCRDYMRNRKQWQEKGEEGWTVSKSFVGALDYLQGKCLVLEESLNGVDFVGVWRAMATGVDRLVFSGILTSNVKFYDGGVERLGSDVAVLYGVFKAWCMRPEGFFPKLSEGLKLLRMGEKQLLGCLVGVENWMKENSIANLSMSEVEKIVRSRVFCH